ncbi:MULTISPECIES: hypothetical protein [Streptococcus]|uniref:hypothetical protein n=1 Tax=Streptococcus TaxID=1301 RepID=UPI00021A1839|nr:MULTISPECIES: hypothetical protein [Streptococcus]MDO4634866.1 hypothetical protein [Streptococcus sp.]HEM3667508.1 hypothetical protein [Streptococcus suis]EGS28009.1 hypothetical protein FSLSAGS3026_08405 [Streptococcus agalactiae FSL S3-026]EPV90334.1 hypothetical protein SAG0014_11245 [Streptococcus agalactiae FSL S3-586]MCD3445421.1 hypothetical protein [Streptococcus equi subsp. zooepidemicus]
MLYFPSISEEMFDFEADWLVKAMDDTQKRILFVGQGKNGDLELELNYQDNPEQFDSLSVGELVQLPKELFVVPEATSYHPQYECF